MFSFTFGPGVFFLLCALLPLVLADNLFAGCYNALPGSAVAPSTGSALRASSNDCSVSALFLLLPQTRILIDRPDVLPTLTLTTTPRLDNVSAQTVHPTSRI